MLLLRLIILAIAFFIDLLFGDPPNKFHPTAWMGSFIGFLSNKAPNNKKPGIQFAYGIIVLLFGGGVVLLLMLGIDNLVSRFSVPINLICSGLILKTAFTMKGLVKTGDQIKNELLAENLKEAQRLTAWHLVSRDTKNLTASQISAATVESIAENTSDSVIAPIFYFFLFGLPGAMVYRFVNTADAMLGYRNEKFEWLGKASARLDDLLNIIPARLTAWLFITAALFAGEDYKEAASVWWTDRYKTTSPNAGHPMGAAAGALGIRLEKEGVYSLGSENENPVPKDIERMLRLMKVSIGVGSILLSIIVVGLNG